jgi:hypothetical protein
MGVGFAAASSAPSSWLARLVARFERADLAAYVCAGGRRKIVHGFFLVRLTGSLKRIPATRAGIGSRLIYTA